MDNYSRNAIREANRLEPPVTHAAVGNPAHTVVNNTAPMDTFIQPKITGYRQLSEYEAQLMNRVKALGAEFEALVKRLGEYHASQKAIAEGEEKSRLFDAEPARWLAMGRTDIQTGVMKIVRSIAQPAS